MNGWIAALEARHLADLTFQEVARSLRALSSTYVERRTKLQEGAALTGAGKRAAFALFYGPLHFLLVHQILTSLGEPFTAIDSLLDLGCGTGASGAGWATACRRPPRIAGIDRHPWAIDEARRTYADLGLRGILRMDDLTRVSLGGSKGQSAGSRRDQLHTHVHGRDARGSGVLLAFAVNEIADRTGRAALLDRLIDRHRSGARIVVVEPLAGFVAPWWGEWQRAFEAAGGRADEWRFRTALPSIVEKLDRAAGLNHRELKGRSLAL
jgi:hypothetical protein